MDVNLDFGGYSNYRMSESRISSMLQDDEKDATHISLWGKIKDFFRTDKKADAYKELYHLLHNTEGSDTLDSFNKLKSFASQEHQQYFSKEIHCDDVLFFVGKEQVGQSSLQKLMNVSDQTSLHSMSIPEQSLFLKMLDTLRENVLLNSDSYSGFIRLKMSDEHHCELLNLYRPQEDVDYPSTEMVNEKFLNYKEEQLLRHLHYTGGTRVPDQFSSIGYQKNSSGVEFTMLHPSISYLMKSYSKSHSDGSSSTELNSKQLDMLSRVYTDYDYNKTDVDKVLNKIYDIHNGTLNISISGRETNQIVYSPFSEKEYLFQASNSLQDISESLDDIFHKWIGSDKI